MFTLLAALLLSGSYSPRGDYYLSPAGNDQAPGTSSAPFLTLDRARDAVRNFRHSHPKISRPIIVVLKPGTYPLATTFVLKPEDSGTPLSPTLFVGQEATISGGQEIHDLRVNHKGWWTTNLPAVRTGRWRFSQLFVNGQRRFRPRLPKNGYVTIAGEVPPTDEAKGHGNDRFSFHPGDIQRSWSNLADIELLCFHTWDMSRMRIGAIDESNHVVTTTGPTGYDADWAKFVKGNRYIVENVREALGDPGEWYVDNATGDFTYIPKPGESLTTSKVVAPNASQLIDIQGQTAAKKYVENVHFSGIQFAYSNWNLPPQGRFFPQAEVDLGAAIHATGWRSGSIKNCTVSHVGEYGIELASGCKNISIQDCDLTDLGAGGLKIGETRMFDDEDDTANHVTVNRCNIAHGGRLHPAAIGVWMGQTSHNTVSNNQIFDLYYTGVSIGWTWGYSKSQAHHNVVTQNHIYDIGQGVLSDMGGIYTLGIEPGTEITQNVIHDVDSFSYGGWGIYPDEGSSHELIENNTVYRTKSGGFHQHYGQENIVRNNVFAFAKEAEIIRTRAEDHLSFTFDHNIVYWKDAPLLGSNWSGDQYKLDNNLYWRIDGKPVDFAGMHLETWHAKGQDVHSLIADPLFEDPSHDNFQLKKNSPALKMGITRNDSFSKVKHSLRGISKQAGPPPAFPVIVHL